MELYELKPTAEAGSAGASRSEKDQPAFSGSSHASLHAKALAFDRRTLFVGSMNLDPRSVLTNTEIGVLFDQPTVVVAQVGKMESRLAADWYRLELVAPAPDAPPRMEWVEVLDGKTIRHGHDPMTSTWQRFKVWFLSLLPIESYL